MATEKQVITTYDGKTIHFLPNSHQYRLIDGSEKGYFNLTSPSAVVGVLDKSQALLIWNDNLIKDAVTKIEELMYSREDVIAKVEELLKVRTTKLDEAKDVGTFVHEYAELTAYNLFNGASYPEIPEDLPEQALSGINAFINFCEDNKMKFIDVERFIYSKLGYAGKLDVICEINGVPTLADFKTSKGVYTSQKYQLAGYDEAISEECEYLGKDLPYKQLAVIHLDKNTGIPVLHILTDEERADCREAFRALLRVKLIEKKYNVWSK